MNKVSIALEFAGVVLPVAEDDYGLEIVPLKPIVEVFGMEWTRQYNKVKAESMTKRLGTCIVHMPYAGQAREMAAEIGIPDQEKITA